MTDNARLIITDGTAQNTASLLVTASGIFLSEWSPKPPEPGTEIIAASPYQDGSHLISKTKGNVVDVFTVIVETECMDSTILALRKFLKLLEKAVTYWTDEYNNHKFWLEIRGGSETNIRYALVTNFVPPEIDNPFEPPFDNRPSTLDNISIVIEHTIWSSNLVVGNNCTEITTQRSFPKMIIVAKAPTANSDDAHITEPATISTTATGLLIGTDGSGNKYETGIRFRAVNIPKDSVITKARIKVVASAAGGDSVQVTIKAQLPTVAIDAFSTYANFTGRSRTTAFTNKTLSEAWVAGTTYYIDISASIIQEVVSHANWNSSPGDFVIFIATSTAVSGMEKTIAAYDHATYSPPELLIEYEGASVLHGKTKSCLAEHFIVPYEKTKPIHYAFTWQAASGNFGPNLVDDTLTAPVYLMPNTPVAGDYLYIGQSVENSAAIDEIFNTIVLHIAVKSGSGSASIPQYWNGTIWTSVLDVTYGPDTDYPLSSSASLGMAYIIFEKPTNWVPTIVNNIYGMWIRCGTATTGTTPQQTAGIAVYSPTESAITIPATSILGDIKGIIDLITSLSGEFYTNLFICARKASLSDSDTFTPYIKLPGGATKVQGFPGTGSGVAISLSYHGYVWRWTAAGAASDVSLYSLRLDPKTYSGRFRAFIRTHIRSGTVAGEMSLKLGIRTRLSTEEITSKVFNTEAPTTYTPEIFDMGLLEFPAESLFENTDLNFGIEIDIIGDCSGACEVDLIDLVLMPVNDVHANIIFDTSQDGSTFAFRVKLISSNTKVDPYAISSLVSDSAAPWEGTLQAWANLEMLGQFMLESEEEYKVYFFPYSTNWGSAADPTYYLLAPILDTKQRYLLSRGEE